MDIAADPAGNMENRGPAVLAVTITLLAISTAFVVLRLISRIGVVRKVSIDDYFIILAWVIAFGLSFAICYGTSAGLGRHQEDVKPEWESTLRKCQYTFSVLYNPALMATKTSICLFYLTLAKNQRIYKWLTVSTLLVVNIAGTALTVLNIVQCRPVSAGFKDPVPVTAHCTDIVTLYLSSAPVNIITDLSLLFLPMPILTGMRLPRNQKIILVVTFGFGAFVAVVDVIRIAYLQSASIARLQDTTGLMAARQGDFSWNASLSFMWSAIEVHVGIICACVPGVKPLASKIFPNLIGHIKHSRQAKNSTQTWDIQQTTDVRPSDHHHSPSATSVPAAHFNSHFRDRELDQRDPLTSSNPQPHNSKETPQDVGTINFVTTPDMVINHAENQTSGVAIIGKARSASLTVFDFVNLRSTKSMVLMNNREALGPLAFVTVLFFLWGFAYGLLDVLNLQFQLIVRTNNAQAIGLHSAYFGAYFVAPVTFGRLIFKKRGFKATFITGLCVYACGTLVFWPSAVLASFPAFLISNFLVGLGVATLELAGNPFIALCGPPQYAEVRLNFSQAVQAIGTVASPLLAKKVLFKSTLDAPSLIDVQWTYLGIALFDVILAVIFFYAPLPEASDKDLDISAEKGSSVNKRRIGGISVVYITLGFGVFSQFCYVGGQEAVSGIFQDFIRAVQPSASIDPFYYQAIGHTVFFVGRVLSAVGCMFIKPRRVLLILFVGLIVTSVLAMNTRGYSGVAMIILISFFQSGIFSTIFAMCLRGLGIHTKDGSVLLTAATCGGAVVPPIMRPVTTHRGVQYGFCVIVAAFALAAVLPLYTAIIPIAKRQVDPVREFPPQDPEKTSAPLRVNRILSSLVKRKNTSSESPTAEHVET